MRTRSALGGSTRARVRSPATTTATASSGRNRATNPRAQRNADPCLALPLLFELRRRVPARNFHGRPGVIDGDEDEKALRRLGVLRLRRIAGIDGHQDVHARASGVNESGVELDQLTDVDRPVKMDIANIGGDTVSAAPLSSRGEGHFVDPFEQLAAVHRADRSGVDGFDQEPVNGLVAAFGGRGARCCGVAARRVHR